MAHVSAERRPLWASGSLPAGTARVAHTRAGVRGRAFDQFVPRRGLMSCRYLKKAESALSMSVEFSPMPFE